MKKNKNNDNIAKLVIVYFVCFLFISIAYSFLNEKLELRGKAGFSENTIRQFSYDYVLTGSWKQGKQYYYQFTVNFKYLGFDNINGWQANINVPIDTQITGCFDSGGCTVTDSVLRIINSNWNGTVNYQNQTFSTSFIMKTSTRGYQLSVLSVNFYEDGEITNPVDPEDPEDPEDPDPPVPPSKIQNITPTLAAGNYWGKTTQFNLSIKNESEIDLSSWELKYSIPAGSKITNIWGAEYIIANNVLTLSGVSWTSEVNAGASISGIGFQFQTTTPAPATLTLTSFTGVNGDQQDVEMEI